jgi:hypothetical protein
MGRVRTKGVPISGSSVGLDWKKATQGNLVPGGFEFLASVAVEELDYSRQPCGISGTLSRCVCDQKWWSEGLATVIHWCRMCTAPVSLLLT